MHSLTSALDRSEWSASRPSCFIPRQRAPGTHWIGDWVGPRAGFVTVIPKYLKFVIFLRIYWLSSSLTLSCILVMRHEYVLSFLCVYF
jgi:hypothetical protein